jgi:hypothetical protein
MGAIDEFALARTAPVVVDPDANPTVTKPRVPPVLGKVAFFITKRISAPAVSYELPLEFLSWSNASGFFLFNGETRSSKISGTLRLSPGRYQLKAESEYYQPLKKEIDWPPAQVHDIANDLTLKPAATYPFPDLTLLQGKLGVTLLRGGLFTAAGKPLPGAAITMIPPSDSDFAKRFALFDSCVTDEKGSWVLCLIDRTKEPVAEPDPFAEFTCVIKVDKSAVADPPPPINPYQFTLKVKLGEENILRQTALRGAVVAPGGRPFPAVKITTDIEAGESITGADGQWFFYFKLQPEGGPANVSVTATAQDGRTSSKSTQLKPGAIAIVPAIELS